MYVVKDKGGVFSAAEIWLGFLAGGLKVEPNDTVVVPVVRRRWQIFKRWQVNEREL